MDPALGGLRPVDADVVALEHRNDDRCVGRWSFSKLCFLADHHAKIIAACEDGNEDMMKESDPAEAQQNDGGDLAPAVSRSEMPDQDPRSKM